MSPAPKNTKNSSAPKSRFLVVFLCFYFFGLALSIAPASHWRDVCTIIMAPVWNGLGFWQQWALFAPGVPEYNSTVYALLRYSNGDVSRVEVPEDSKQWRLRQIAIATAPGQNPLWGALAQFLAQKHERKNNQVQVVSFFCQVHRIDVPWLNRAKTKDDDLCKEFCRVRIAKGDQN